MSLLILATTVGIRNREFLEIAVCYGGRRSEGRSRTPAICLITLQVSQAVLPRYRSRFGKHQFTQPQLLTILCLMRYEGWTFRELYRRRSLIESVFPSVQRKLSARALGRSLRLQVRQALLLGLSFNLHRLGHRCFFSGMSTEPNGL